jgi:cytochrome c5
VKVVSAEDYTAWVAAETKKMAAKQDDPSKVWTLAELTKKGEKVYVANCAACHQPNGKGAGPIKALDGAAVVLDADAGKQINVLLNGQNVAMPAWTCPRGQKMPKKCWLGLLKQCRPCPLTWLKPPPPWRGRKAKMRPWCTLKTVFICAVPGRLKPIFASAFFHCCSKACRHQRSWEST